ncbi:MAG TPA: DUF2851 domain-containing protein [Flavobacterium sp.]|nr:DUF2851 domain-containing protein [Flavobacterium sp.]
MKEDFLHYIWLNKRLDITNLKTTDGHKIEILNFGHYTQQAGPDFFNAQLIIDNQQWAGNLEIHVKSSDWFLHNHETDANYNNVILHVVWEHDSDVYRKDNSKLPVLELKKYISKLEIEKYLNLTTTKSWIFCENDIASIDKTIFSNWLERLYFERLETKIIPFQDLLNQTNSDWEATLFCMLAKNFGLNINGKSFFELAQSIPFHIIKKESSQLMHLEALFFQNANLLSTEKQDVYAIELQEKAKYLHHKYQMSFVEITPVQFFKLRPDNFPTIRLAQLAMLYHTKPTLFLELILANTKEEIYNIFSIAPSKYWNTHYNFDKESAVKSKKISTSFIDLLIINTIIPLKFLYAKSNGKEIMENLLELIQSIKPEKNVTTQKFSNFNMPSTNALHSQALLQQKNEYCNKKKCLQCSVGVTLLKK